MRPEFFKKEKEGGEGKENGSPVLAGGHCVLARQGYPNPHSHTKAGGGGRGGENQKGGEGRRGGSLASNSASENAFWSLKKKEKEEGKGKVAITAPKIQTTEKRKGRRTFACTV